MLEEVEKRFSQLLPAAEFCSIRVVRQRRELLSVRRGRLQPVRISDEVGAMVTVLDRGGLGYAATPDLSSSGLSRATARALEWAQASSELSVEGLRPAPGRAPTGRYESPILRPWRSVTLDDRIGILMREAKRLKVDPSILDWGAGLWYAEDDSLYLTGDGGRVEQQIRYLVPSMHVSANRGAESQTRTLGGGAYARQGGLEVLDDVGFYSAAPRIADEALQLLAAPNCPTERLDLLLAPDQMYIQIHESIGHPLELDRILGDERNYAGRSFVTPEMFGSYQYGSEQLNVTFDPTLQGELASCAFDDEGQAAEATDIIRAGLLLRPLGGMTSQIRSGLPGVANARASSWNRPAIDRIGNLNLEPGESTIDQLIRGIEHGVYMEANRSWSIDDSRNKFQFGCEWGRLIDDGELGPPIKNPNYRGVSATFWRSLKNVGNRDTLEVLGTPTCGKGEPNQGICVGHASPVCHFNDVDVFGGA